MFGAHFQAAQSFTIVRSVINRRIQKLHNFYKNYLCFFIAKLQNHVWSVNQSYLLLRIVSAFRERTLKEVIGTFLAYKTIIHTIHFTIGIRTPFLFSWHIACCQNVLRKICFFPLFIRTFIFTWSFMSSEVKTWSKTCTAWKKQEIVLFLFLFPCRYL